MTRIEHVLQAVQEYAPNDNGTEIINVLDIGCGKGTLVKKLMALRYNCIGIDVDKNLESGWKRNVLPCFVCRKTDTLLHLRDLRVITMCECVEHMKIKVFSKYMKTITKVLVPGGCVFITTPNIPIELQNAEKLKHVRHVTYDILKKAFPDKMFEELFHKNITKNDNPKYRETGRLNTFVGFRKR